MILYMVGSFRNLSAIIVQCHMLPQKGHSPYNNYELDNYFLMEHKIGLNFKVAELEQNVVDRPNFY